MKITFISDTHNLHDKLKIEPCDVLVHCGDVTTHGTRKELFAFLEWFDIQPAKYKIFIAGNHDMCLDPRKEEWYVTKNDIEFSHPNIIYLNSSFIDIEGIRFYGHPWTPYFGNMAFNTMNDQEDREKVAMIKPDTDILISHGPPYRFMDKTLSGEHVGSKALQELYTRGYSNFNPAIHAFGHIHECYEVFQTFRGSIRMNVANHTWLWKGAPYCPPISVEYEKGGKCQIL